MKKEIYLYGESIEDSCPIKTSRFVKKIFGQEKLLAEEIYKERYEIRMKELVEDEN